MNINASSIRFLVAAVVCATAAATAGAAPVYSTSSFDGYSATLFPSYTLSGNAGVATTSAVGFYASPAGLPANAPYLYASPTDGAVTVDKIGASSFSFLWGSPDLGNKVTYHTSLGDFLYTGQMLNDQFGEANGQWTYSTVFTASLGNTGTINSVTFTSDIVAFEVDGVQKLPEPASVALVSAALGALAWTGRRRKG